MKERLIEIINDISDVCGITDLRPDDNTILTQAMTNYRGERMNKNKSNNPIKNGVSESKGKTSEKEGKVENKVASPQKPSKVYHIKRETKERWAKERPTEKQKQRLRKMEFGEEEINQMSKLDVHTIFENNKKENI